MNRHPDPFNFHHVKIADGREHMRCPKCNYLGNKVTQTVSASSQDKTVKGIGRKRKCYNCEHRWRTIEINTLSPLFIANLMEPVE